MRTVNTTRTSEQFCHFASESGFIYFIPVFLNVVRIVFAPLMST